MRPRGSQQMRFHLPFERGQHIIVSVYIAVCVYAVFPSLNNIKSAVFVVFERNVCFQADCVRLGRAKHVIHEVSSAFGVEIVGHLLAEIIAFRVRVGVLLFCGITQLRDICDGHAVDCVDRHFFRRKLASAFILGIFCAHAHDYLLLAFSFERIVEHEFVCDFGIEMRVLTARHDFKHVGLVESGAFAFFLRLALNDDIDKVCNVLEAVFVSLACKHRFSCKTDGKGRV